MAQAHTKSDKSEEDTDLLITCGICLSVLEQPKALICLHSFCLKCLQQVHHPPGRITCPLCQEDTVLPTGGVGGLRDNFFINQIKEMKVISRPRDVQMMCSCCQATDLVNVARCVDCNGFLCQQCFDLHSYLTPLKSHAVFTIEDLRSGKVHSSKLFREECYCSHKDQIVRFFCNTCGIPICHVCTVIEHCRPEHDYVTMEAAIEGQTREIKRLLESCRSVACKVDTVIEQEDEVKAELKSSITKANTDLLNAKEAAKKDFLERLENYYNCDADKLQCIDKERCATTDKNKASLSNLRAKLRNAMELASQVLASGSNNHMASNYTTLASTLKQLEDAKVEATPYDITFVVFSPDPSQVVKPLGQIRERKSWTLHMEFGKDGGGKLGTGIGVAFASTGDIAIADYEKAQVKVYTKAGHYKLDLDTSKELSKGQRSHPWNVAVDDEQLYVTDLTGTVKIYNMNWRYLKQFPILSPNGDASDTDGSELFGLAIDNDGHVLVGNNSKKYISKCKKNGTHITSFEVDLHPEFIAVTPQGRIVISPYRPMDVHIHDHSGKLIHAIKQPKDAKSWKPSGICCSGDGIIYVASWDAGDKGGIYSFTEDGEYIECITTDVKEALGLAYSCEGHDKFIVVAQDHGLPAKIFALK